ncbi:hypothetical protein P8452_47364 [Trifolium repens]|nr:hypothetical protein P8452_47364 [Trifolium repens]
MPADSAGLLQFFFRSLQPIISLTTDRKWGYKLTTLSFESSFMQNDALELSNFRNTGKCQVKELCLNMIMLK